MPTAGPHEIAFSIRGPITRVDLPGLCERVRTLLAACGAEVAYCDVEGIEPDAVTIDALARLQLAARRQGCRVRLRGASPGLLELVSFMGLSHVLPAEGVTQPTATPGRRAGARTGGTASPPRGRT